MNKLITLMKKRWKCIFIIIVIFGITATTFFFIGKNYQKETNIDNWVMFYTNNTNPAFLIGLGFSEDTNNKKINTTTEIHGNVIVHRINITATSGNLTNIETIFYFNDVSSFYALGRIFLVDPSSSRNITTIFEKNTKRDWHTSGVYELRGWIHFIASFVIFDYIYITIEVSNIV